MRMNELLFFFQAEDGIRDYKVTGVQTCALPIFAGIAKVVPLEVPGLTVRHLDTDPARPTDVIAELIRPAQGALLAVRGGRAWTQEHHPAPVAAPEDPTVALREEGVYAITGGLGGVGITLAEDLATRVRARLVLFDRTGLPPRAE